MPVNKTFIAVGMILTGIALVLSFMLYDDPYFFTTEPQVRLPVGTYYQGSSYLELKPDGNYSLYEEVSGNLSFASPYHEGHYLVENGYVYLKVIDGGLWSGRKFHIVENALEDQEGRAWKKAKG